MTPEERKDCTAEIEKVLHGMTDGSAAQGLAILSPLMAAIIANSAGRDREKLLRMLYQVGAIIGEHATTAFGGIMGPHMSDEEKGITAFIGNNMIMLASMARSDDEAAEILTDMLATVISTAAAGTYPDLVSSIKAASKHLSSRATDMHNAMLADKEIGTPQGNA